MAQLLYLSASGGFRPLARRPAGCPNEIAGQPCVYLKKDLIHCGHYTHPAKGFNVPVDRKRIDEWVANFRKMRANGVKVPINLDHSDRAADCVGYVVEMNRSGDELQAICQFIGSDAAEVAARNYVSVGIDPAYTDGQDRDYGDAIVHVALTPVPIVPDQAPFALAASASPAPVAALAATHETQEKNPVPMYQLTCHESTLRGLYRHVPGMEQAPPDQKIACLCRHLEMIARLDEKYGLAPARMHLWNFNPDQARDWRGKWTPTAGTPEPITRPAGTSTRDSGPTTTQRSSAPATQPTTRPTTQPGTEPASRPASSRVIFTKRDDTIPDKDLQATKDIYNQLRQAKIKNAAGKMVENPFKETIDQLEDRLEKKGYKVTIRAHNYNYNGTEHDEDTEHKGDSYKPGIGSGSLIKFNPNDTRPQDGEADNVLRDPRCTMAHELYHALRNAEGTAGDEAWGGPEDKAATLMENKLRKALGLPERLNYGKNNPLSTEPSTQPSATAP